MNIVNLVRCKIYYVRSYKVYSDREQNISYLALTMQSYLFLVYTMV